MADAVISIVAERVAAIIEDQIRYEVNLVRGVEKKVLDFSDKLKTIRNVLDDAENRGAKEESVKNWLKKLENMAYEMDDILDEWNYALLKHKMRNDQSTDAKQKVCCSFIPSSSCLYFKKVSFRRDTAMKIQNVKAKLDEILKEKDDFKFVMSMPSATDYVPKPPRIQSTSSIELEKVYGHDIDRNKNDIVEKLMLNNGDSQLLAMSIVGMGGLGKTTLAQLVYNDSRVKDCFGLGVWICVSDPFDVAGIARGIVNSVGRETIPRDTNQLELVMQKLRDSVLGKKFLLVLDDVWTERSDEWEPLKNILKCGAVGSKIIVTTRKERVAKMMGTLDNDIYRPQQLTEEECWSLLRRISHLGRSEVECEEFEDVGKKIAEKCKGLPLAANVLGSLLQFKNSLEEWENVWKSEIWELKKAEVELFPHLLLSYNELSPSLKRCFSYCAIYPKDYRINVKSLVHNWMALGYLGSVSGNSSVEVKRQEYFNDLAKRSLFQDLEKMYSGESIEWCKMHDIVHDFAQYLNKSNERVMEEEPAMTERSCQVCDPVIVYEAQQYRSLFWDKRDPPNICDCLTSVRVLRYNHKMVGSPQGMEKLIHLRLLELSGTILSKEDLKMICRLYFLQTLLLEDCSLREIPQEIGNLVHLSHLALGFNNKLKELPDSICRLHFLENLLLTSCPIKEIPGEIGNLVRLRHLELSGNEILEELPESICSLLQLQILGITFCCNLYQLPEGIHNLKSLQELQIWGTPASCHLPLGVGKLVGLRSWEGEFHAGSSYNKLRLLKNLNRLTRHLFLEIHLRSSSDVDELVEEARGAQLRNKVHVEMLGISFCNEMDENESSSTSTSTLLWMDVIEAMEPHRKLAFLGISGYEGTGLPRWISSPLNLVKKVSLGGLSKLLSLPPMGKLPFLEVLDMREMYEVKVVGREFLGIESSPSSTIVDAFPKLKKLTFHKMSKLREWEDITAEEEESSLVSIMPCLEELHIESCEGLKKLPDRLLRKASSSLRILNIKDSPQLIESYVYDEDGRPTKSMYQNDRHIDMHY